MFSIVMRDFYFFIYLFLSLGMKNVLHGFMQIFGIKTKNVAIFYN